LWIISSVDYSNFCGFFHLIFISLWIWVCRFFLFYSLSVFSGWGWWFGVGGVGVVVVVAARCGLLCRWSFNVFLGIFLLLFLVIFSGCT
jgi:hypothetical protein